MDKSESRLLGSCPFLLVVVDAFAIFELIPHVRTANRGNLRGGRLNVS